MRRSVVAVLVLVVVLSVAGCSSGPMESREGNVKVTLPVRQETVTFVKQADGSWKGSVHTIGSARAFEATVSWQATQQLSPDLLASLGQGNFMTSAGAPEFGTFDQTLVLVDAASNPVPEGKGTLRIFITSMKDGSQQDIVDIPLILRVGQ
ncbi:MAG: Gmad2 immunoglobulin-like domain-containing protein [Caldiserica bacterium]|nr:Gmad2 immunoglobulin-like domain-containing protein [Caldisericota bacterium]